LFSREVIEWVFIGIVLVLGEKSKLHSALFKRTQIFQRVTEEIAAIRTTKFSSK
jgi:hypothetical protein